ncbi:hypothetical protein EOD40_01170 [Flavobacterium sufflavum]|uniref:Fibronectin type-III domain-containing protein n=1 Tax=Flavobacterium sufflavum TaxID=1921138 RepID=A0A437L364_9FLAO|nr:hypothetical protein [Flavobacterium sufflavum]RVT79750.1 hypothetical protein EOD40_01170 [Flavobacterium sufflavum]
MRKCFDLLLLLLLVISSCSSGNASDDTIVKEPDNVGVLATLKTNEAEDIAARQALVWGILENNGGTSVVERGVCYGTIANPNYEGSKSIASVVKGTGEFKAELTNLEGGTVYYARAYAVNKKGVAYGNQISFKTKDLASPLLVLGAIKVAGAQDLFFDVELKEHGDLAIQEIGLVYNTVKEPTVANNKIARSTVENKFKQRITNLTPETLYYVRPYAVTTNGVLYGEEFVISTIKKGNFTYSFNQNGADAATVNRIKAAFDLATTYYNNFTSIVKHVTVNYSPGTPTADANFAGWINVGSNAAYQKAGTAMHEMAHTVGIGQHSKYWELMYSGTWHGKRANEILQMMTNDPNAVVKGDNTHFWPYGVNGSWEDDGSDFLYMMNALILQGMKADGLPSN